MADEIRCRPAQMNQAIEWPDGMRGVVSTDWWRFEKRIGSMESVFCRGEGHEIMAGRFVEGEDILYLKCQVTGLGAEGARTIGKAICRAMYEAVENAELSRPVEVERSSASKAGDEGRGE